MQIDHFAVATPSLDEAVARFAGLTGVRPAAGGSHPGMGTRNALVALGPELYLAIDGPDTAQPLVDNNGASMSKLAKPSLGVFVVRTDDLAVARMVLERAGFECEQERLTRFRPDGEEVAWLSLMMKDHGFGCAMPIISQWLTPNHPATDAPQGCLLQDFVVRHPEATRLAQIFSALGLKVSVEEAAAPGLHLSVQGPAGNARFE